MRYTIEKNIFKILVTSAVGSALVISLLTANSVNIHNQKIEEISSEIDEVQNDIDTYAKNADNIIAGVTKTMSDIQYELDLVKKHAEDLEQEDSDMQVRVYKLERKVKENAKN